MRKLSHDEVINRWIDHLASTLVTMMLTFEQDIDIYRNDISIKIIHSVPPKNFIERLHYEPKVKIVVNGIFFRYVKECIPGDCPLEIRNLKTDSLVDIHNYSQNDGIIVAIHDDCALIEKELSRLIHDKRGWSSTMGNNSILHT